MGFHRFSFNSTMVVPKDKFCIYQSCSTSTLFMRYLGYKVQRKNEMGRNDSCPLGTLLLLEETTILKSWRYHLQLKLKSRYKITLCPITTSSRVVRKIFIVTGWVCQVAGEWHPCVPLGDLRSCPSPSPSGERHCEDKMSCLTRWHSDISSSAWAPIVIFVKQLDKEVLTLSFQLTKSWKDRWLYKPSQKRVPSLVLRTAG